MGVVECVFYCVTTHNYEFHKGKVVKVILLFLVLVM